MNTNITEENMKIGFIDYLEQIFGEGFSKLIKPPDGARYGERLIYKYKDDAAAERHEVTQQALDEFNKKNEAIAKATGGSYILASPPVTSGLPFPRLIDLNLDLLWPQYIFHYLNTDESLPYEKFKLEWVLGLLFASDSRFFYMDFTDPKVKGIFCFDYDFEHDMPKYQEARKLFTEFIDLMNMHKKQSADNNKIRLLKIASVESKVSIRTINYGRLARIKSLIGRI